jgi:alpha-D-ribose 1-methylphosphonate 5-triphosphate diphosphatase
MVDIHGDGFERALAPRDGSIIDAEVALRDVDAQLAAHGITTACYSPTLSWQAHRRLRTNTSVRAFIEAFERMRPQLVCDSLLHLRYEIHHLAGEQLVADWLDKGLIDFLAFNDHLSWMRGRLSAARSRAAMALAFAVSESELDRIADGVAERAPRAFQAVQRLSELARSTGVPMCAHDEETPEVHKWYHDLGVYTAEFPITLETAEAARAIGDDVVLGAPNVLKGASLYSRLSAREAIANHVCTILASDYHYPSLLHAPAKLIELGLADLSQAWELVSGGPAHALGLDDRGAIALEKRADLIMVDTQAPGGWTVLMTVVGGVPVYCRDVNRLRA